MIIEMQNASKEKAEDKASSSKSIAIISRERVANCSKCVSIQHRLVNNVVHELVHELEDSLLELKLLFETRLDDHIICDSLTKYNRDRF